MTDRIPGVEILTALGIDRTDPRCPKCRSRFEVCDDPSYGASFRCAAPRCRIGRLGWQWPTLLLAEIRNIPLEEAERSILACAHEYQERAVRRTRHEAALDRFNAAA